MPRKQVPEKIGRTEATRLRHHPTAVQGSAMNSHQRDPRPYFAQNLQPTRPGGLQYGRKRIAADNDQPVTMVPPPRKPAERPQERLTRASCVNGVRHRIDQQRPGRIESWNVIQAMELISLSSEKPEKRMLNSDILRTWGLECRRAGELAEQEHPPSSLCPPPSQRLCRPQHNRAKLFELLARLLASSAVSSPSCHGFARLLALWVEDASLLGWEAQGSCCV